jgi:hypothetical protein
VIPIVQPLSCICQHTSAYVSMRQHTSAHCVSAYVSIRQHTSAYVSIRQHTSAHVSIRQHTSAHVSIRQHTSLTLKYTAVGPLHFADACLLIIDPVALVFRAIILCYAVVTF